MELTFGECTLDVGDEPTKERRAGASQKPAPLSSPSAAQLPVTKSVPPHGAQLKEEKPELGAEPVLPAVEGLVEAKGKDGDAAKAAKAGAGGFSISKPPPGKKVGARDSVPPGS